MDVMMGMMPATAPPPQPPDMVIWFTRNQLYAKEVWWFVSSFIGLVAISQILSWVSRKAFAPCLVSTRQADSEGQGMVRRRRRDWSRLPLAFVNYFRVVAFRSTIDVGQLLNITYAEAFITVGYIVGLFVWTFVNTTNLAGQSLNWQYWSGRAGTLAVSQFPLVTVLGTKNNILSYITGVSYDKLNYLHRMTARVAFVLLWIHGGTKLAFLPQAAFDSWFIQVGLAAISGVSLLFFVAFRPFRARFYETFFYTHFFMVLLMLVGGYFHANQAAKLGPYIWPCFLIWGFDRALRLFRVVYFNNNLYAGGKGLDATLELLSPQFVKLSLTRPPQFKWTPGQAAFLIAPGVSRIPIEAHPFTIASDTARMDLMDSEASSMVDSSRETMTETAHEKGGAIGSDPHVLPYWEAVDFFINVRDGFTKRLAAAARKGEKVRVFVDGPYGFSPNVRGDDTVVLVAGGSGVSLAIAMFLGVVSDVQNGQSRTRKLVFIWSIRDAKQMEWICKALVNALELAPPSLEIAVRIFVTGGRKPDQVPLMNNNDSDSDSMYSMDGPTPTNAGMPMPPRMLPDFFSSVQITPGRPDIPKMLKDEVAGASGRLSVTVCGSAAIAKTCRDALRLPFSTTLFGGPSVVLHVESFGYA
ncbi:ferric reductase NAD binding domain-containing protein [Cerioporus squamosus]|nr:ferric reductase NAD binding domain-containing protein [Cerioporus squamosus]